jgi:hypothetical protein
MMMMIMMMSHGEIDHVKIHLWEMLKMCKEGWEFFFFSLTTLPWSFARKALMGREKSILTTP